LTKPFFDYQGLTNVSPQKVARASFLAIDRFQEFEPHEQAAAAAVVLLTICEACAVEPQDVFVAVKNLLMDEREGKREQFRAVQAYVENEIAK
jgi:hypothetical protein